MQIISELEGTTRGPNGGCVGYGKISGQWFPTNFDATTLVGSPFLPELTTPSLFSANDSGTVVGYVSQSGDSHSFVAKGGQVSVFPFMSPSSYYARLSSVNAGNVAVGADEAGSDPIVPVAWSSTDGYINLKTRIQPTAGVIVNRAFGISSAGVIVGQGTLNGVSVGIILTPVTP